MERLCLDCNSPFNGRADKKFCDDLCRSSYNNRLKASHSDVIKSINQILRKNRQILKSNSPTGKTKIKQEVLASQGYNFDFHTHTYTNRKDMTYFFCYEYGYVRLENGEVLLVRRDKK